jgi:hypothetical protein
VAVEHRQHEGRTEARRSFYKPKAENPPAARSKTREINDFRVAQRVLSAEPMKTTTLPNRAGESGRVGYLVLYMLGAPVGLLILLWVLLGNNIFGPG